jgi:predicted site-specific integrase-resolvase
VTAVDEPELLLPSEASQLLKIGTKTLRRWREKGLIQFVLTPGGRGRYYRAEIESLLSNQSRRTS